MKEQLVKIIEDAVKKLENSYFSTFDKLDYNVTVEKPRDSKHGDYATNIALILAAKIKKNPLEIGEQICNAIDSSIIENKYVARPGFINFSVSLKYLQENLKVIHEQKEKYGTCNIGKGEKVHIDFVSANPTGPLHIGHGRWAALGDSLARILTTAGYEIYKEFYVNDIGNQIVNLGNSLKVRYIEVLIEKGKEQACLFPTNKNLFDAFKNDGKNGVTSFYHGIYLKDLAQQLYEMEGENFLDKDGKDFAHFAMERILKEQKDLLDNLRVYFDNWFKESDLHLSGKVDATIEYLKNNDKTIFKDNALWLKGSEKVKDNVLIKSDGTTTYFASDVSYHKNKYDRGFERLIDIWGADHHGHVQRMKTAAGYLGKNPDSLEVIIGQLVTIYLNKEVVKMSKRTGEMITLKEVVDEVGVDALRYLMLMKSPDNTIDFDMDIAKEQSKDNPVFYVQYAHARISSILRMAESKLNLIPGNARLELLTQQEERQLMFRLADYKNETKTAALERAPHRLTFYASALATEFHQFYTNCRVLNPENLELTEARLNLAYATKIVLRNLLEDLLGVTAPTSM